MRVEVLYVAECPFYPAAVKLLKDVLAAEDVVADIREVLVTDGSMARELRFCGSPTIRINGRDIAGESQSPLSFAFACRMYPGTKEAGVPPLEMMQRAVREARLGEKT